MNYRERIAMLEINRKANQDNYRAGRITATQYRVRRADVCEAIADVKELARQERKNKIKTGKTKIVSIQTDALAAIKKATA